MTSHGAVPLTRFSARLEVLGATAQIDAFALHAGPFEDGLALLVELDERWGPTGELAALATAPSGEATTVSWDTLLLLAMSEAAGVALDLERQTVRCLQPITPPSLSAQHSIAARLVAQELHEAGCIAVRVIIGDIVEGSFWLELEGGGRR